MKADPQNILWKVAWVSRFCTSLTSRHSLYQSTFYSLSATPRHRARCAEGSDCVDPSACAPSRRRVGKGRRSSGFLLKFKLSTQNLKLKTKKEKHTSTLRRGCRRLHACSAEARLLPPCAFSDYWRLPASIPRPPSLVDAHGRSELVGALTVPC